MIPMQRLAQALDCAVLGRQDLAIRRLAEPGEAGRDDLAMALSPAWAEALKAGAARAALLWPGADWQSLGLEAAIIVPRGRLAMAHLTALMDPGHDFGSGAHPTALIDPSADIGAGCAIGPFAVIGAGARIGAGSRIGAQVTIAAGSEVGADSTLHPGVRIGPRVRIGPCALLHPGVVIGADGFSFVTATPAHVETARADLGRGPVTRPDDPTWHKIHSLGGVDIGADVEIGANSTVDAGTIRATRIGAGCKIDNLVQIGHNVTLGAHCLLSAQSGVAGSTSIGDRVVIGGKAGIADNLKLGDDVVIGGGSVVLSNVPAGRVMLGSPAMRMDQHVASYKALRRLPRILRRLAGTDKAVSNPDQTD